MLKESEKDIERCLTNLIKLNGGLCIKLLTYQFLGLPDRMCLMPHAKIAFVELKSTGIKPRKIQLHVHDMLRKLGFRVEVLDTKEQVINFVNDFIYGQT